MKRFISLLLAVVFLFGACGTASARSEAFGSWLLDFLGDSPQQEDIVTPQQDAVDTPQGINLLDQPNQVAPNQYVIGTDVIPSIITLVGERECTMAREDGSGLYYSYNSSTVRDDLRAYIDLLGTRGFTVVSGASLSEPGNGELTAPSSEAGYKLTLSIRWTLTSYSFWLAKFPTTPITPSDTPSGAAPSDVEDDVLARGMAAMEAGDYMTALAIFDSALMHYPDTVSYHCARGDVLTSLELYEEALAALNTALSLASNEAEPYIGRGVVYYYMGELALSLSDFRTAIALGAQDESNLHDLGILEIENGLFADAVATLEHALTLYPESGGMWDTLGYAYYYMENYSDALRVFKQAVALGYCYEEDILILPEIQQMLGASSTPAPGPAVILPTTGGTSKLVNYIDWLSQEFTMVPMAKSILDNYISSERFGDLVEEGVAYPRRWPSQWLDGAVPAYTGTGWMYDLYVARPVMSYAAKDVIHVAVTVYDYLPEEVNAYIAGLAAYGFSEVASDFYIADWIEGSRAFRKGDCTLTLVYAHGEAPMISMSDPDIPQAFVQFNVDFERAAYVPNLSRTPGTQLLNLLEFAAVNGDDGSNLSAMDETQYGGTDEYGMQERVTSFPSQWPKEIFGEIIPEFTLPAFLAYLYVTAPAADPVPQQTFIVTATLVGFYPEYEAEYARQLAAFGYQEVPREEYDPMDAEEAALNTTYHIFRLPNVRVYLVTFGEGGDARLQISIHFDGRSRSYMAQ